MAELRIVEAKILDYMNKSEITHIDNINRHIGFDCMDRIVILTRDGLAGYDRSGNCFLRDNGKIELQNYKAEQKSIRKTRRRDNIRWIITTLIALAALIKSFFF